MSDLRLVTLLGPDGEGATSLDLRFNAREVAAVQLVLGIASDNGIFEGAAVLAARYGVAEQWSVAFQSAQLRLGVALARAFQPERAAEFSALLAEVDQLQTALDNGEEA